MSFLEEDDGLSEETVKDAPLRGGDDAVADARQDHHRAVSRGAAKHEQADDLEGHQPHFAELLGADHAVENWFEQECDGVLDSATKASSKALAA